jgi:hypothetical protein
VRNGIFLSKSYLNSHHPDSVGIGYKLKTE